MKRGENFFLTLPLNSIFQIREDRRSIVQPLLLKWELLPNQTMSESNRSSGFLSDMNQQLEKVSQSSCVSWVVMKSQDRRHRTCRYERCVIFRDAADECSSNDTAHERDFKTMQLSYGVYPNNRRLNQKVEVSTCYTWVKLAWRAGN